MATSKLSTNMAIAEALNTLNSRIEKTESDFIGHLQKVEDRLDQIVDLTKTVAVLQQQSIQQTDQISEVRTQFRENAAKFENSITRIHSRLDDIVNNQRDKLELHDKELEIKINSVKTFAENTEKELKTWLNRGWGVWAVFGLVFVAVQTVGFRWLDSMEKDKAAQVQTIKELVSSRDKTEVFVKQHEQETAVLKNEMYKVTTATRDLEDLIRRQNAR